MGRLAGRLRWVLAGLWMGGLVVEAGCLPEDVFLQGLADQMTLTISTLSQAVIADLFTVLFG